MRRTKINETDSEKIKTLIMTTLYSRQELVNHFNNKYSLNQVSNFIKKQPDSIKKKIRKENSRGNSIMKKLLKEIFPQYKIEEEFSVGQRLRLDLYIGEPLNIGFEFDGKQHSEYTPGFHNSFQDFADAKQKDKLKEELCAGRGINLVRISYKEDLTIDLLKQKINEVGQGSGKIKDGYKTSKEKRREERKRFSQLKRQKQKEFKETKQYQDLKERQKEYAKQVRERAKALRKSRKQSGTD